MPMNIVQQLSSQVGDRTEESNRQVVSLCLDKPERLAEIGEGLRSDDAALIGDCAEVMTKIAEQKPESIVPFAKPLAALLKHRTTRVRWESMHALALIAPLVPDLIESILPQLADLTRNDKSTIVRDYAIECLGNYAKVNEPAAKQAYPILKDAITLWDSKHLARVLNGFCHVALSAPSLGLELLMYANDYSNHSKGTVKKAAKSLLKVLN